MPTDPSSAAAPLSRNELNVTGDLDAARPQTVLHLGGGRSVALPTELLLAGLPPQPATGATSAAAAASTEERVIPLAEEQIHVEKRTVVTGTVRLHRSTETFTDSVGLDLTRTGWEIERVPIGQLYPERPEIREEDDMTIFPLVEERLVAKREYFLIEEVRVRRVASTTQRTATLQLKRDVLTVERESASPQEDL